MDWQTLLTMVIVGVLFLVMMRGCGSMAAGGCCGMGSRRRADETSDDATKRGEDSHPGGT